MTKVYERCGGSCPDNEPTNPCADCVTHQPTEAKLNGVYCVSDDTAHVGPWTTVRACLDCGVLVSGGPTRCSYCADKITATEKQAASFAAVIEALKRRVHEAESWIELDHGQVPQPFAKRFPPEVDSK